MSHPSPTVQDVAETFFSNSVKTIVFLNKQLKLINGFPVAIPHHENNLREN